MGEHVCNHDDFMSEHVCEHDDFMGEHVCNMMISWVNMFVT